MEADIELPMPSRIDKPNGSIDCTASSLRFVLSCVTESAMKGDGLVIESRLGKSVQ